MIASHSSTHGKAKIFHTLNKNSETSVSSPTHRVVIWNISMQFHANIFEYFFLLVSDFKNYILGFSCSFTG